MKNRNIILIGISVMFITLILFGFITENLIIGGPPPGYQSYSDDTSHIIFLLNAIGNVIALIGIIFIGLITIFSLIIIKEIRKLNNNK